MLSVKTASPSSPRGPGLGAGFTRVQGDDGTLRTGNDREGLMLFSLPQAPVSWAWRTPSRPLIGGDRPSGPPGLSCPWSSALSSTMGSFSLLSLPGGLSSWARGPRRRVRTHVPGGLGAPTQGPAPLRTCLPSAPCPSPSNPRCPPGLAAVCPLLGSVPGHGLPNIHTPGQKETCPLQGSKLTLSPIWVPMSDPGGRGPKPMPRRVWSAGERC